MHVRSFSFNFIYRKEHPIVCEIYNLLKEMFGMAGEYESNKTFHESCILITADEKELQLFRIILNAQQRKYYPLLYMWILITFLYLSKI